MITEPLKKHFYICPECCPRDVESYARWVLSLAELPMIHDCWQFSDFLWSLDRCPNCGAQFPSPFHVEEGRFHLDSLPFVLEWATMEAMYERSPDASVRVAPMRAGWYKGSYRSGFLFEILAWVGLAVASGVIGNVAYESIKRAVLDARRSVLRKRSKRPSSTEAKHDEKSSQEHIQPYLQEWDSMTDEELERHVEAIYRYAKQRLSEVDFPKAD